MTRSIFYIKSLIFFIIGAYFVFFADDKKSMMWHANWTIITIMAYAMWHDWNIFPDFIRLYVVRKLLRTEANPEPSLAAKEDIK